MNKKENRRTAECRMSNVEGMNKKENRRTAECRMSNVEGRNSVYLIKWTERSDTTLRHSAVHYSMVLRFSFPWFCGSLFPGSAVRFLTLCGFVYGFCVVSYKDIDSFDR